MKTKKIVLLFLAVLLCLTSVLPQVTCQWRGENRDGIYKCTNLMIQWPEKGPALLWSAENIGNGYSCPVTAGDVVIVTGEINGQGFLSVFNSNGELQWKTSYGTEYPVNNDDTATNKYSGSRSTPTVAGDLVYICTGLGKIVCINVRTGSEVWSVDMISEFNGRLHEAGYSESLVVDGDVVYCTPGGIEKNVVALNRFTGETIWTSSAMSDSVCFTSPLIINLPERKLLVIFTHRHLSGLDAATGELLWGHYDETNYNMHAATPVYENGFIYYISNCGRGIVKLELSGDGKNVKEIWRNNNIRSGLHSPVKINDILYYSDARQKIRGIDINNGTVKDSLRVFRGPVAYADSKLYCYSENGTVSLIKLEGSKMELAGSFKIEKGTREHLTLPFIEKGVMYIRHGDALMAYDISDD